MGDKNNTKANMFPAINKIVLEYFHFSFQKLKQLTNYNLELRLINSSQSRVPSSQCWKNCSVLEFRFYQMGIHVNFSILEQFFTIERK